MVVNAGQFSNIKRRTWSDNDAVVLKDVENNMNGTGEQRGSSKENGNERYIYIYNQRETGDLWNT